MSTTSSIVRFDLGDREVPLRIKKLARAKSLRLRVDPASGGLLLTLPRRTSQRRALDWAAEHRVWAAAQVAALTPQQRLLPGATLPLCGEPHLIVWDATAARAVRVESGRVVLGGPEELVETRLVRWLRSHARDVLDRETRQVAASIGAEVRRVGVGDTRSRWGSCSSSGSVRYSWRLILAPEWVRGATVAHEVAHLVHMNHGSDFHRLVERLYGSDPEPARLWLRRNGAALHAIGGRALAR